MKVRTYIKVRYPSFQGGYSEGEVDLDLSGRWKTVTKEVNGQGELKLYVENKVWWGAGREWIDADNVNIETYDETINGCTNG